MVFKVRSKLLAQGGIQSGSSGTNIAQIVCGTVSACVPQVSASAVATGSMAIAGLSAGDKIFLAGSGVSGGVAIYSAIVSGNGAITASYMNPTGTNTAASTLTFQYLGIKTK